MRGAFLLTMGLACSASAARAQVIVAGPVTTQITATPGERVTIPLAVNMVGAPGIALGSYGARFTWNPALMRLVSATPGTFAAPVVNADSAPLGVLRFAAASSLGASGIPVLANITLEVTGTSIADTFRVSFSEMDAALTFQDLLPFLTVTNGSFCAGAVFGDLNSDGVIQALDAQIALMHAVGMAVADTANGDVDADGIVGTRDALIILSDVVGLDVSAFRIGTFVSGVCTAGSATALNVIPASMTLAAGDTFRVSAQVRDSAGNLLGGTQLVWSSSNPAVASMDSTGTLRALTDGTVTITGSVSPALSGTGSVTVGPRHRWRVDPANAQGSLAEIGSDLYPFSTIAAAVAHAAAADTIAVAAARYAEPLSAAMGLVFMGDSGPGGMPIIATPNRPAGQMNGPGTYVVRRFRVEESQAGLSIVGDTVSVSSLVFVALRGPALRIVGPDRATVRGVTVDGVGAVGIGIDTAGVVQVANVRVTGVEPTSQAVTDGVGLFVRADTVFLDTVTVSGVAGAGIITRDAERTRVRRLRMEFVVDGLRADSGGTLEVLDSTVIRFVEAGAGITGDFDTLRVLGAVIEDVGGPGIAQGPAWFGFDALTIADTRIERAGGGILVPYFGATATLRRLTIRNVDGDGIDVRVTAMDVDTILVEQAGGDGLNAYLNSSLTVDGSTFRGIAGYGIYGSTSGFGRALITGTRIENARDGGIYSTHDTLELLADTVVGTAGIGIEHDYGMLLTVRDVLVRGTADENLYTYSTLRVDIARSRFDTAGTTDNASGIEIWYADTVRVDSSAVRGSRDEGISINYVGRAYVLHDTLEGNFRFGSLLGGSSFQSGALHLNSVDTAYVRHNMVRDNRGTSISVYPGSPHRYTRIDSNSVRGPWTGLFVSGVDSVLSRIEVVDNAFTGRIGGNESYQVYAQYLGQLLVSGNTFDSIAGYGVYLFYGDSLRVLNNVITNQRDGGGTTYALSAHRVGTAVFDGNTVTCTGSSFTEGVYVYRATVTATNNVVSGCARGVSMSFDLAGPDTAMVAGNRIGGAGVLVGGIVVRGSVHATLVNNVVTDGVFSDGAIAALGTRFLHVPNVSITGDSVLGGAGRGIVLQWVDTADVSGATVSGLGSLYADTTSEAGIWLRNVFGPVRVHGSRVTGSADAGILLTDTTRSVVLDTNLVADNLGSGVVLRSRATILGVPDTVRANRNSLRRNQPFGVRVDSITTDLQFNNIEGNAFGLRSFDVDVVDASNSWWGDALGPACDTALGCAEGTTGDSIAGPAFAFSPPAADTIVGSPPGGPPAMMARTFRAGTFRARVVPLPSDPPEPPRAELPPPPVPPAPPARRVDERPAGGAR